MRLLLTRQAFPAVMLSAYKDRSHGQWKTAFAVFATRIGTLVISLQLPPTILQTVHPHLAVKPLLIQPMLTFHLAIMAWRGHSDSVVDDPVFLKILLEKCLVCCLLHQQRIRPFYTVVRLNLTDRKRKGGDQFLQKIQRAICAVLVLHFTETETGTLIHGGILVVLLSIGNAVIRHKFHIDLYFLTGIISTHIQLGLAILSLLGSLSSSIRRIARSMVW